MTATLSATSTQASTRRWPVEQEDVAWILSGPSSLFPPGGDEAPPVVDLQKMILGEPQKLRSQFRLTYNMILNLLRVEALKIEEMIKRSFSEHATQQLLPEHEKAVKVSEADLAKIKRDSCEICDVQMDECHQAAQDYRNLTEELYKGILNIPIGRKIFSRGALIIFQKDGIRTPGILLADGTGMQVSADVGPTVHVLEIKANRDTRDSTDMLPLHTGLPSSVPRSSKAQEAHTNQGRACASVGPRGRHWSPDERNHP